ncbi:hypothetical protein H6G17_12670 [Chroococcidiopsis sp. FACHB-1243]|uniref:hypothetical protein n=1 Tax=Chroococcidiopsis sp. [FACHB-1243] TaxID=2692781 RepID=UPI0019948140|nr:hypothetical protein [Chroococcidiopsis sp. [FACHB-1243]]MBD2306364.1 hypothetical protein [Chroococcidiopsis sp. [FACHB-1243]]
MTSDLLNGASFAFGAGTRQEFRIWNSELVQEKLPSPFSPIAIFALRQTVFFWDRGDRFVYYL